MQVPNEARPMLTILKAALPGVTFEGGELYPKAGKILFHELSRSNCRNHVFGGIQMQFEKHNVRRHWQTVFRRVNVKGNEIDLAEVAAKYAEIKALSDEYQGEVRQAEDAAAKAKAREIRIKQSLGVKDSMKIRVYVSPAEDKVDLELRHLTLDQAKQVIALIQ